jgi:predicted ATPase
LLRQITLRNLTVFSKADLHFGKHLNVFVGENGAGKTHLLKMAYAVLATSWEEGRAPNASLPTKTLLQSRLADKLINVFRPDSLGRLASRQRGRARCDVAVSLEPRQASLSFSFATSSQKEVVVETLPTQWVGTPPAYFPTRELLTIYPNFLSVYESHYLEFEETWRDTCRLLGEPVRRGPRDAEIDALLSPLEETMGGRIELDGNGRFYLRNQEGRIEMPLVAEGLRKFGMLARLIATGTLLRQGYLFWDEPETNLNPRLVARLADIIVRLSRSGVQMFIATHSLFLLRELELLLAGPNSTDFEARFFGLHRRDGAVAIEQGSTLDEIGDITALDEELAQSDRYQKAEI